MAPVGLPRRSTRARHAQAKLRNQLPLNLVGTATEGQRDTSAYIVFQLTLQESRRTALADQPIGANHLAELAQDINHRLRTKDLGGRGQRHIHPPLIQVGSNTEVDQAHGLDLGITLRMQTAYPGLVRGAPAL